MNLPPYNPADLESIRTLCGEGYIPKSLRTIRELCRTGKFPAIKDGCDWKTTRPLVRGYFHRLGNTAFRRAAK